MRYVAQRLVLLVAVLFVVTFLSFLLVRVLPGDPVLSVTGIPQSAADDPQYAERIAAAEEDLNLDKPIPEAYLRWMGDLLPPDVDLGYSFVRNTPVQELLGTALPRTAAAEDLNRYFAEQVFNVWNWWSFWGFAHPDSVHGAATVSIPGAPEGVTSLIGGTINPTEMFKEA